MLERALLSNSFLGKHGRTCEELQGSACRVGYTDLVLLAQLSDAQYLHFVAGS